MKDVTANNIKIVSQRITTGNLTATGTGSNAIEVEASGGPSNSAFVKVNGNVKATNGGVFLQDSGGSGISVTGKVSAGHSHGRVSISDAAATVTVSGDITAGSNVNISGRVLNFGNITAVGHSINITERNSSSVLPGDDTPDRGHHADSRRATSTWT